MKISVITVCFNASSTIDRCIQSVLAQSYSNVEYIIVDGSSTDGTQEVVSKYSNKIAKFISEPDNGIYFAMNKGITLATGDVVGMLNADDVFAHSDVLAHIARVFSQLPVKSLYADLQYLKPDGAIHRHWKSGAYKDNCFAYGWMPPHPTFYVRREIYQKYGMFNTSLRSAADYELMLRFLHIHKISTAYLPEVTVKMMLGGVSNSSLQNRLKANREDQEAWKINGLKMPFYLPLLKPLRKLSQYFLK